MALRQFLQTVEGIEVNGQGRWRLNAEPADGWPLLLYYNGQQLEAEELSGYGKDVYGPADILDGHIEISYWAESDSGLLSELPGGNGLPTGEFVTRSQMGVFGQYLLNGMQQAFGIVCPESALLEDAREQNTQLQAQLNQATASSDSTGTTNGSNGSTGTTTGSTASESGTTPSGGSDAIDNTDTVDSSTGTVVDNSASVSDLQTELERIMAEIEAAEQAIAEAA